MLPDGWQGPFYFLADWIAQFTLSSSDHLSKHATGNGKNGLFKTDVKVSDRSRVGAYLTVGSPPGTVRAPLDAHGSTSDTTEGHILQRGFGVVSAVACM